MTKKKSIVVSVDFDGTLVSNKFPEVGKEAPHASEVLKELIEAGKIKVILLTMRDNYHCSDPSMPGKLIVAKEGDSLTTTLEDAVQWCKNRGIELYGVNHNPGQYSWSRSPKVHSNLIIDDCCAGIPKVQMEDGSEVVDWLAMKEIIGNLVK